MVFLCKSVRMNKYRCKMLFSLAYLPEHNRYTLRSTLQTNPVLLEQYGKRFTANSDCLIQMQRFPMRSSKYNTPQYHSSTMVLLHTDFPYINSFSFSLKFVNHSVIDFLNLILTRAFRFYISLPRPNILNILRFTWIIFIL